MKWLSRGVPALHRLLDRWEPNETLVLTGLALVVGVVTAGGAMLFHELIGAVEWLAFEKGAEVLGFMGRWYVVPLPMIGGLIVFFIAQRFLKGDHGHGVSGIMSAVALHGGRMNVRHRFTTVIASAITIGTGGSVGPEDPSVQVGAAFGSGLGQILRLSDSRIRTLVACGAAAGISSAFNAPIAGVFFALEIVLGEFTSGAFGIVVLASVVSAVFTQAMVGNQPAFQVPTYTLVSEWELVYYLGLGVLAALVAAIYIRSLYRVGDLFHNWAVPTWAKTVIGAGAVGVTGVFFPQIFGIGYDTVEAVLQGHGPVWYVLLILIFIKPLATSVTLAYGGKGGVFAPSLFLGAMLGGLYGQILNALFPTTTAPFQAYALVGMAAVLAGAVRAPITAVLILFEMTNDYRIILPLMFATGIATLLSEVIAKESVYTLGLLRQGIRLERGRDIDVMQGVLVSEAMTQDIDTVTADMPLLDLEHEFATSHHHGFPVMDQNEFVGIVTLQDLNRAQAKDDWADLTVGDIATHDVMVAYPSEPIYKALQRMGARDVGRLPVVSQEDPNKLIGLVRRNDIVRAYQRAILRRLEMQDRAEQLRLGKLTGKETVELVVEADSQIAGKAIKDLALPEHCPLVSARRGRRVIMLRGDTVLEPGDHVTAVVARPDIAAVQTCFMMKLP